MTKMISDYFYNDIVNMKLYAIWIVMLLIIYIAALVWHEYGHMLVFKKKVGRDIKGRFVVCKPRRIRFYAGLQKDYDILTDEEYYYVCIGGIIFGLIPIVLAQIITTTTDYLFLLIIFPYLITVKKDIKYAWKTAKKNDF